MTLVQHCKCSPHDFHYSAQTVHKVRYLPSFARGLLTTYCLTSSSLARLKSLRILLALLGPRRRGTVLSVSPGMSFSPGNQQVDNTKKSVTKTLGLPTLELRVQH